jgi:hypothetical protein
VGRILRCRQQDLLRLPRRQRGRDQKACRDQRLSREQDHASQADDRSHHRRVPRSSGPRRRLSSWPLIAHGRVAGGTRLAPLRAPDGPCPRSQRSGAWCAGRSGAGRRRSDTGARAWALSQPW